MDLPIIELASLPDLDTLTGVFGSLLDGAKAQKSDDTIIVMMTFLYDLFPPPPPPSGGSFTGML